MIKQLRVLIVATVFFWSHGLWAQLITPLDAPHSAGSEFFVGKQLGKPLITVNLINGVVKPGVYHVPIGTSLAQLLAYAGGANRESDLTKINIQRRSRKKPEVVNVDLQQIIKSTSSVPRVSDRDIIQIEAKPSNQKLMTWLTVLATVASIGVSVSVIYDISRRSE